MPIDAEVRAALIRAKRTAAGMRGVQGIDYGYRYAAGKRTDELAVRFHVLHKHPTSILGASELLPRHVESMPVDVVEASYRVQAGDPRSEQDALSPGISVGNVRTSETGTLGCLVVDGEGASFILSNWHVLAGAPEAVVGDAIVQPGPMHSGPNLARTVAVLDRSLALTEQLDAALGRVDDEIPIESKVFGFDSALKGIGEPVLGAILSKSGAVSGVTSGIIDGIEGTYQLNYQSFGFDSLWMRGFRLVRPPDSHQVSVSEPGDSGAIWFDEKSVAAVGLHFGGESDASPLNDYAIAHSMSEVLERLAVAIAK